METSAEKGRRPVTAEQMFARQALRAELVPEWIDALRLKPGDRVLDIGSGPGFVSFILAERVGPSGLVYAVDKSADFLAYLGEMQDQRGIANIRRIVADAATVELTDLPIDAALIAMVLHHTGDPAGILTNAARFLAPGSVVVIGEFHPEGPCEIGVARDRRLSPETIRAWCEDAGLRVIEIRRQTPEHYMLVAERRDDARP